MRNSWLLMCVLVGLGMACSDSDSGTGGQGGTSVVGDASAGSAGATDARSEQATGGSGGSGGTGGGKTDATSSDALDASLDDARDASSADKIDAFDVQDTMTSDVAFDADAAGDVSSIADAEAEADAMSCRTSTGSDAAPPDAAGPGTITDLMGYSASDVLYVTWSDQAGAIPRNRHLELRFAPLAGVCAVTRAGQLKANSSQLRVYLMRANFLMFGTLPSFFVPGTYPLNENVYEQDAGIASVAEVSLVTTDASCRETFVRATAGNVTLTSVTPGHVAGSFTATFDDAGTISGRFDVDLCFDAELPDCPYSCTALEP